MANHSVDVEVNKGLAWFAAFASGIGFGMLSLSLHLFNFLVVGGAVGVIVFAISYHNQKFATVAIIASVAAFIYSMFGAGML